MIFFKEKLMSVEIKIAEIIGSELCLSNDDGHKVYALLYEALNQGKHVSLSFAGVKRTTTAFLNVAIGQLYGEKEEDFIREHLKVTDAERAHLQQLKRVVDGAKLFFRNKEAHEDIRQRIHDGE